MNAATTLIPWTLRPATVELDSVCVVYITLRDLAVPTAALDTMGRLPTRNAGVSVGPGGTEAGWEQGQLEWNFGKDSPALSLSGGDETPAFWECLV